MNVNEHDGQGKIVNTYEIEDSESEVEETRQIPVSAIEQAKASLADPSINSIAEVKTVLKDFFDQIE